MELNKLFQQFANMEHEQRVELGRGAMEALVEDLTSHGVDKEHAFEFVHLLVTVALSADRLTAAGEYALFVDITGADISYEQFYEITNGGSNEELINGLDEFLDGMTESGKNAALTLALCFIAADDKITPEEQRLFAKLLA